MIAGVTQGSKLVNKFKSQTAQSLTQSSPVTSIADLAYWFESTSEKSFSASEAVDEQKVSNWYDISPRNSIHPALSSSSSSQPIYKSSSDLNGLPALYFDTDQFTYDGYQYSRNTTMFAVIKAPFSKDIVGNESEWGNIIGLHKGGLCALFTSNLANDMVTPVNQFQFWGSYSESLDVSYNRTSDNGAILTGVINGANLDSNHVAYKFYTDGNFKGSIVDTTCKINSGLIVGASYPNFEYYQGYIGELIVFNRALNDEERKSVDNYLSQKWNIPLNN